MNEKVIIDGVDVSGCVYYDSRFDTGKPTDLTCTKEHAPYFRCESMPNCIFKQLQQAKAELHRMTRKKEIAAEEYRAYEDAYYELEAENKDLKEKLKIFSQKKCPNCGDEYLTPTGAELFEENEQLKKEISTLQGKIDAFQMSENEANEIIAELKEKNKKLNSITGIFSARLCKKYRKALEEIKRVAEEQIKRYPDSFKIKDAEYYTIIEICDEVLK